MAIVAAIMALNPIATDMMLPAMPDIRAAFGIANPNHVQEVISVYLAGFGAGQFIMGPLSDRFGRRPVLIAGMLVYSAASLLSVIAPSFEMMLLARVLQGIGTSAARVIATSIVRDCYTGRRMASVMSLAMMIFIAVPVLAPSFGQAVMLFAEWRGIFVVLTVYGLHGAAVVRDPAAGNAAGGGAQAADRRERLRRIPPDPDQPANARLCARRRRHPERAVRLRVFVAADLHRDLRHRRLFPARLRRHRHRHCGGGVPEFAHRRPLRHAGDLAQRADRDRS